MSSTAKLLLCGTTMFCVLAIALVGGCPNGTGGNGNDNATNGDSTNGDSSDDGTAPPDDDQVIEYQLTVIIEGSGTVEPSSGDYDAGTEVTLAATASTGWRFDRWEGDLTGSANPASITMSADRTVTAVFVAEGAAAFNFYAVYDRIVDADQLGEGNAVGRSAMSGDGAKAVFSNGASATNRKAYALNTDGSGLTPYTLPDGEGVAEHVAISEDGSRAYFASTYDEKIFKIEGGVVATISWTVPTGPDWVDDLHTTADGEYVLFRDYGSDVWRVKQDGSGLTKIIDDAAVPCVDGTGAEIYDMAVSADGGAIAFQMVVRRLVDGSEVLDREIFAWQNGTATELTVDRQGLYCKGNVAISGDGQTVVYQDWEDDKFYAIGADGANSRALEYAGFNFGGLGLTHDGTQMFYSDANADGGRLVETDGSGVLDLFPAWNVTAISLGATYDAQISRDGTHVFFRFEYATFPFKNALYLGHLNDVDAVPGAPQIESIAFSPVALPRGDADARIVLTTAPSDPQGLADITRVVADELLEGKHVADSANLPAYFYFAPHDDGESPDATAGDGVYSTEGQPGGKISELGAMTVRVGVKDATETVVVADTVLAIGP